MRGVVSEKLKPFLEQVNCAVSEAKANNVSYTVRQVRENLDKLAIFSPDKAKIAYACDKKLCIDGHSVEVKVYSPAPKEALPVLIYFHGGGHLCGSAGLYDPMCRKMAIAGHCIVINVDYRLAPEFPFPAGIDDGQLVVMHYNSLLTELEYNQDVYIGGDSAGGAICTTLANKSLTDERIKIDKQVLIYPSVDYTLSSDSVKSNGSGFLLEVDKVHWYFRQYFQNDEDVKKSSPLYGNITENLPESLVITAGCDPLRDEGLAYLKALKSKGVKTSHLAFDDMVHAFMNLETMVVEECARLYQGIGEFIKQ